MEDSCVVDHRYVSIMESVSMGFRPRGWFSIWFLDRSTWSFIPLAALCPILRFIATSRIRAFVAEDTRFASPSITRTGTQQGRTWHWRTRRQVDGLWLTQYHFSQHHSCCRVGYIADFYGSGNTDIGIFPDPFDARYLVALQHDPLAGWISSAAAVMTWAHL
ncbi:hypothetical protein LY76DRAFT_220276 [Colletotrichum caudatum]|nr:hypothetical protein LY76DRAFT_220276 [Colletotrichum caudatum]